MISFRWLFSLIVMLMLAVIYQFPGGIDITTYESAADKVFEEWSVYYSKEIVSWGLIALAFKVLEDYDYIYSLVSISLFMWLFLAVFMKDARSNFYLSLMLVSPFGVLLSLNILRQYIAVLLFFMAVVNLVDKKYYAALLLSILSILSHNTLILFVVIVYALSILGPKLALVTVIAFSILVSQIVSGGTINSEGSEVVKLISHFMYVLGVYAFIPTISYCCRWLNLEFGDHVFKFSCLSIFILLIFGAEIWQVNRLLVTLGFFLLLYITYNVLTRPHNFGVRFLIMCILISYNLLALFLHSGALTMLNSPL